MTQTTAEIHIDRMDFLAGGGEMGKLMRSMDWSQSPLGPLDSWPPILKQTTSLVLASNFPLCLIWGSEHVQLCNDGYQAICAAEHPGSMGHDCEAYRPSTWSVIRPSFERCVETGQASSLADTGMFLERDGHLEETFFTLFFSPIRDETGQVVGVFHPVIETTQLVLAKRRHSLLRRLTDHCAGAGSVDEALTLAAQAMAEHPLDLPFVVLYRVAAESNKAELAGSAGISAGHPACPALVNLDSGSSVGWPLEEAMRGTGPVQVPDLEDRFAHWTCGPYPQPPRQALIHRIDAAGQPAVLLIAGVSARRPLDEEYRGFQEMLASAVTVAVANAYASEERSRRSQAFAEVRRTEALLQRANQELEILANALAHDLRAPIRHINGFAAMLEEVEATTLSQEGKQLLQRFRSSADRMGILIDGLLGLSRLGRGGILRINVDNEAMVLAVWNELREQANATAVLELKQLPPINADPVLLRLLWQNLIGNAVKFSGSRQTPRVTVEASHEGERTWYRVVDNGVGFDERYAYKLFTVFQRLHRTDEFPGTGVGLAIAKKIIDLHGGFIRARSASGGGAVFEFTINQDVT